MSSKAYAWGVTAAAAVWLGYSLSQAENQEPISTFLFWILILVAVELLPVSLELETEVTMSFPIHLALAILFPPWMAMLIALLGALDIRELRREIALHHALFNRAQLMLAVGLASATLHYLSGSFLFEIEIAAIIAAALVNTATNLGLVTVWVHLRQGVTLSDAFRTLLPDPMGAFWISYALLAGLGAATAVVYREVTDFGAWAVAAFIIPLLFARLSVIGARNQQKLTERVHEQQRALLEATENVLSERESERKRLAAHIHDSSLQLLAAATYGCTTALDHLATGDEADAREAMTTTRSAIEDAIQVLRSTLVDLRRSWIEEGGFLESVGKLGDQVSTLWGVTVDVSSDLSVEPPLSIALGAFQIVQEGLINAVKHAETDTINVRISDSDGTLYVVVEDLGRGFDATTEDGSEEHMGIQLMRNRAADLGGRMRLHSRPGEGTTVEAILPSGVSR